MDSGWIRRKGMDRYAGNFSLEIKGELRSSLRGKRLGAAPLELTRES